MKTPSEAYQAGYAKGAEHDAGGTLAELTTGMLRDDPGGHFASGYRDGAAGKKYNPPFDDVRKPAAELNPFDDKVAIKTVCPHCEGLDWFEWKFLGRLNDPVCGHSWYVGSGTYAAMQLRAGFAAGSRFAKYLTSSASGEGAWIAKFMGWVMGTVLGLGMRLEFGILMIPIQAIAGLFQPKNTGAQVASRVFVVGLTVVGAWLAVREIQHARANTLSRVSYSTPTAQPTIGAGSVAPSSAEANVVSWQPEGSWIGSLEWDGRFAEGPDNPYHAIATESAQIVALGGIVHVLWHERRVLMKLAESGELIADYDAALQFSRIGNELTGDAPLSARWRTDNNSWQDLFSPGHLTGTIVAPDSIQFRLSWATDSNGRETNGSVGTLKPFAAASRDASETEAQDITGSWTHASEYDARYMDSNQPYHGVEATSVLVQQTDDKYLVHWYEIREMTTVADSSRLGLEIDAIFSAHLDGDHYVGSAIYARRHYSSERFWSELARVPFSASLDDSGALQAVVVWETNADGKELASSRPMLAKHEADAAPGTVFQTSRPETLHFPFDSRSRG